MNNKICDNCHRNCNDIKNSRHTEYFTCPVCKRVNKELKTTRIKISYAMCLFIEGARIKHISYINNKYDVTY